MLEHKSDEAVTGSARMICISSFTQFLFLLCFVIDFFILEQLTYTQWFYVIACCVLICFGICRLLIIFKSMQAETNGSILMGISSIIVCFDVWYIYWIIYDSIIM